MSRAASWFVAALVMILVIGYLAWLALVDPEIEFLRPSLRGDWIAHPGMTIRSAKPPVCPDAVFELRVACVSVPSEAHVSVSAFRGFRLDVNESQGVAVVEGANWKGRRRLDLMPYLRTGTNIVRVTAFGTEGPPALLVEGPSMFRSGTNWVVGFTTGRSVPAVVAGRGEGYLRERTAAIWRHPKHRLFGGAFAAYIAFIVYALVPLRLKPWLRKKAEANLRQIEEASPDAAGEGRECSRGERAWRWLSAVSGFLLRHGISLSVLAVVAIAQYRNVAVYPHTRSPFDVKGHVEYVRFVAENARVPMARDGWEMFQPPLYYFSAAAVYRMWGGRQGEPGSLKAVQYFTATCGLMTLVFALGLLWLLFPDRPLVRHLGFASIAFLPVHFYMNPMITNEVFAGAVIAGALVVVCWALRSVRPAWGRVAAAALACGVGMLSKYSGLFLFLAAGLWLALRALAAPRSIRAWSVAVSFAAGVLLVSGWYYQRNAVAYGNFFIGNWDKASGFHYEQPPGFRTLGFYTRFGSVFSNEPERSRWATFWDGQYGSIWADSHAAILAKGDRNVELRVGAVVCLAVLPTAACLLGFWMAVAGLLRRKWDEPLLVIVVVTVLSIVGVMAFTMEVPTYSTVKGFFLLSLIPAAAVFAGLGFELMARQLGRLRWFIYASMAALGVLVLQTYRFGG